MLAPKQKRAILMIKSSFEKLLRMFPCVLLVKTRYPGTVMSKQAMRLMPVETCVTVLKLEMSADHTVLDPAYRSRVGM